jgi:hypothetical protein
MFESTDGGSTWSRFGSVCPAEEPLISRAVATGRQTGYVICTVNGEDLSDQPWELVKVDSAMATHKVIEGVARSNEVPGIENHWVKGLSISNDGHGFMWTTSLYETGDGGASWRPIQSADYQRGGFGPGGELYGGIAYLLWVDDETSSVVQFAGGQFTTLGTWQRSLVALASQR